MKAFHRRALCIVLAALLTSTSLIGCQPEKRTEETAPETSGMTDTSPAETLPATQVPTETDAVTEAPDPSLWIVKDGKSEYGILDGADTVVVCTLADEIQAATGVSLTLLPADADAERAIHFISAENVGNYGYRISVSGERITIAAASLAGYDKAIDRLMADATVEGGLKIAPDYAAEETLDWAGDYTLNGAEDYKAEYRDGTFYNDKNDAVAYVSNAMWHMFGLIDDGQNLVYRFGNEPTWFEWMSEKVSWSGDTAYINELKGKLQSFAQTSTGYMWSWGDKPYWQVGDCYSIHYDGTFRFISAVYDVISWEGSTDFLHAVDGSADGGVFASVDASKGRTVLEKTEACMNYILEYLHGKEGYILITEESTYLNADGSERFDYVPATGGHCWNNTGRDNSTASNYWDNLCFGNYDAYENALFYQALNSMAGIYRMLGGDYIAKARELEALAVTVKETYNRLYWSEEAGRFIACIDADGRKVDYGFTFVNTEAMKYGLVDADRAKMIFDWIDGDRIIEGEKVTGENVLSYAQVMLKAGRRFYEDAKELGLRLAPITNTVPINNSENRKTHKVWWHGPAAIDPWSSAEFGRHLENGGYIFYTVFYELMARTTFEGAQSTTDRLHDISRVYEYNRLVSDQATWLEGLIGEFPESGLVPTTYLYALVGANASYDGLHITPAFNDVYEFMGVKKLTYGGHSYGVEVNRNGSCTITATDGVIDMDLHYTPARFGTRDFTVTMIGESGRSVQTVTPDADGILHVDLSSQSVTSIVIEPVLTANAD